MIASKIKIMGKSIFAKAVLIVACLPLIAGCVVGHPRPVVVAPPEVVVEQPPSEPPSGQIEIVPESPGPAYVWVKGRYEWRDKWIWIPGRWVIEPRPHAFWVAGHWEQRPQGFVWIGGHWR